MKIAHVAPLAVPVPPVGYGGTERVVDYLVEGLVKKGHDVTLFASGDSQTSAKLVAPVKQGLWKLLSEKGHTRGDFMEVAQLRELAMVKQMARHFDVIHFHTSYYHYPIVEQLDTPTVTTMHHPIEDDDLVSLHRLYPHIPLVSISHSQRAPLPEANWVGNIYHGMREDLGRLGNGDGGYLVYLGRMVPHKGADKAIEIAKRLGLKIILAGNTHPSTLDFFNDKVACHFDDPMVEYIGEIDHEERKKLFGGAVATLFPIEWREPFGLVMIESMACGTPVIGFNCGSVPEVIEDGITGYVVNNIDEAVEVFPKVREMDRKLVRERFLQRFVVETMVDSYEQLYSQLITLGNHKRPRGRPASALSPQRSETTQRSEIMTARSMSAGKGNSRGNAGKYPDRLLSLGGIAGND